VEEYKYFVAEPEFDRQRRAASGLRQRIECDAGSPGRIHGGQDPGDRFQRTTAFKMA